MPSLGARALPESGHIRAPIDPTALRDRPVVARGGSNPARQSRKTFCDTHATLHI